MYSLAVRNNVRSFIDKYGNAIIKEISDTNLFFATVIGHLSTSGWSETSGSLNAAINVLKQNKYKTAIDAAKTAREQSLLLAKAGLATNAEKYIDNVSPMIQATQDYVQIGKIVSNKPSSTARRILFVGDSITASELYSYSYLIKRDRKDLTVDVLAKGGQTTQWMLENLIKQLASKNYDKVYVYGGVNDSMNDTIPTERTLKNLQEMVNLISKDGAKPYIITGIEPDNFMDYRKMPTNRWTPKRELYIPMIAKYKRYQQAIPNTIKGATIIPVFILNPSLTQDGIHPTSKGQLLMRPIVEKTI